jgi:hypothetical protein
MLRATIAAATTATTTTTTTTTATTADDGSAQMPNGKCASCPWDAEGPEQLPA